MVALCYTSISTVRACPTLCRCTRGRDWRRKSAGVETVAAQLPASHRAISRSGLRNRFGRFTIAIDLPLFEEFALMHGTCVPRKTSRYVRRRRCTAFCTRPRLMHFDAINSRADTVVGQSALAAGWGPMRPTMTSRWQNLVGERGSRTPLLPPTIIDRSHEARVGVVTAILHYHRES
jgi:hypothetical protein